MNEVPNDDKKQLKLLKNITRSKNIILKKIYECNTSLLGEFDEELGIYGVVPSHSTLFSYLRDLEDLHFQQKKIWKVRHKMQRKKYDESERGRELSRIRSQKNYQKKKAAKAQ